MKIKLTATIEETNLEEIFYFLEGELNFLEHAWLTVSESENLSYRPLGALIHHANKTFESLVKEYDENNELNRLLLVDLESDIQAIDLLGSNVVTNSYTRTVKNYVRRLTNRVNSLYSMLN